MTQSAADIMAPFDMIKVSIEDDASDVSERVLSSGRTALVESSGQACAILSLKGSQRLITQPGRLAEHRGLLRIIGQTPPTTNVIQLAEAMAYDRTMNGFVVMELAKPVGVITMHRIFNAVSPSLFPSLGIPWSFVNPPTNPPTGSCYCCPRIPHQVPTGTEVRDPADQVALCPTHNEILIFEFSCPC